MLKLNNNEPSRTLPFDCGLRFAARTYVQRLVLPLSISGAVSAGLAIYYSIGKFLSMWLVYRHCRVCARPAHTRASQRTCGGQTRDRRRWARRRNGSTFERRAVKHRIHQVRHAGDDSPAVTLISEPSRRPSCVGKGPGIAPVADPLHLRGLSRHDAHRTPYRMYVL